MVRLAAKGIWPSIGCISGLAVPLFAGGGSAASAVLLVLAAVLTRRSAAETRLRVCPALRRLANCYGVYPPVHHVLLTLVFLRFVAQFNLRWHRDIPGVSGGQLCACRR